MTTLINPGILVKSQLTLQGLKIKDLAAHCGKLHSAVSQSLIAGSIPIPMALSLEALGVGTAQQWIQQAAAYRLHRYLAKS